MYLHHVVDQLQVLAPLHLAESWDNVGLLTGDPRAEVSRVLLTVDATPAVFDEAERAGAQLLVSYHPLLLKPVCRLQPCDPLFRAARAGIAVYSPHTALDAAEGGTNATLAELAGVRDVRPLCPHRPAQLPREPTGPVPPTATERVGQGRVGTLAEADGEVRLPELAQRLRERAKLTHVRYAAAEPAQKGPVRRLAFAAGAGDGLVDEARRAGADVLVTGELRHHTLLACLASGLSVVLLGHDGSERPALPRLQQRLREVLDGVQVDCGEADASRLVALG